MMPQIILLGAPGAGKGTQAAQIVEKFKYKHISTGDLLRQELAAKTELGKEIASIMEQGKLVADDIVFALLAKNCDLTSGHYIFDGFPRTIAQAKALDEKIIKDYPATAIYLDVPLQELIARICNRRVAPKSGQIYNLISKPPKRPGFCDISGEPLIQRKDDTEEVVKNRFKVFQDTIGPIMEHYAAKGLLHKVDATIDSATTFNQIAKILETANS